MADTPNDLAEKLKALATKPAASFVATEPVTTEPVLEEAKVTAPVAPTSAEVKPTGAVTAKPTTVKEDVSPQMNNLIKEAVKRNEKLNNKKIDFEGGAVNRLANNDQKVKQILKDCGLDSQMAERAYSRMLKELD